MTSSKKPTGSRRKRAKHPEAELPAVTESPVEAVAAAEPEAAQSLSQEGGTNPEAPVEAVEAAESETPQSLSQEGGTNPDGPVETVEAAGPETPQAVIQEEEAKAEGSTALVPAIAKLERDQIEDEEVVERVEHLNRGVGWVLISAGIVGMVVPGVLGTPFLIMGGLALWPGNRKRVERWRQGHSPKVFHGAMKQINRFLDDLEKRYPRNGKR